MFFAIVSVFSSMILLPGDLYVFFRCVFFFFRCVDEVQ